VRNRDVNGLELQPDTRAEIALGDGGITVVGSAIDLDGRLSGRTEGAGLRTGGGFGVLTR
jgi:hypothetical protein